jgi:3-oxoadipate enol-lactonase
VSSHMDLPWLPNAKIVRVEGRGEFFVRHYEHSDPAAPTVLMLHGWTASADLQFFTAYQALAQQVSFIAIDHRGHGRGLRTLEEFTLEDAADDAVAVAHELGVDKFIVLGYSMGGPIALNVSHRHPQSVDGIVVQATALEWRATWRERFSWRWLPFLGATLRSWGYPRYIRHALPRLIPKGHALAPYVPWLEAEIQRGNPHAIVKAGRALSQYDARPWAGDLGKPAAMLITTRDRLVKPRKQRALAAAIGAQVREIPADHLCTWAQPDQFASLTVELVEAVRS